MVRLKAIGINMIPLYLWLTTPSITSNVVTKSPNITTDANLRLLIAKAHELEMAVNLVPYVKVEPPGGGESVWRGKITPPQPVTWFTNYRAILRPYERLAEELKVELFTVGSELYALQQPAFVPHWNGVVTEARTLFKGKLTYQSSSGDNAAQNMTWWNLVDFIGVSPYYSLSPKSNPPVNELVNTWKWSYLPSLKATSQKFNNKKVLFAEIGYTNNSLTAWKPAKIWDLSQGALSPFAQANAYEALLQATSELTWFAGVQWFHWGPAGDGTRVDYNPRNKPAECVIAIWWSPNRDGTLTSKCPGSMFPRPT
jgi:hypothetical protein